MKKYFSYIFLSSFWVFALLNPVFKKYDYGAGWPLLILFALGLGVMAFTEFKQKRERAPLEKFTLAVFMVAYLLSFIFSETRNIGLSETVAFLSMPVVYFFLGYQKIKWGGKFLKVVVAAGTASVFLGYLIYFLQPETRMFGPFFNIHYHANEWPNAFALFLLMVWPLVMMFAKKKNSFKLAILTGFILSGLLLTFSRGALIAFFGQGVLFFIYYWKDLKWRHVNLAAITLGVAILFAFTGSYLRSFNQPVIDVAARAEFANSESLTSVTERVDFWKGAIEITKKNPLFGTGPFSFRYSYNPIQKTFLGNSDHPHNVFLKIASENGIIAVTAFVLFLASLFFAVAHRWRTLTKNRKKAVFILSVSVLGALAHSLIDYNFNFVANFLLFFMLLALIRSLLIKRAIKFKKSYFTSSVAILLALVALFEGTLLAFEYGVKDRSYLNLSLYPRGYYLAAADMNISEATNDPELYSKVIDAVDEQLKLNRLDSRAYFLKAVAYSQTGEIDRAFDNYKKAIRLNPMNDWAYYLGYARLLNDQGEWLELRDLAISLEPLMEQYFIYAENNVHFTAYTPNIEDFAELVKILSPQQKPELLEKLPKMLQTVEAIRAERIIQ